MLISISSCSDRADAANILAKFKVRREVARIKKKQDQTRASLLSKLHELRRTREQSVAAFRRFTLMREFDDSYRKYDALDRKIKSMVQKFRSDPVYYNKIFGVSTGCFIDRKSLKLEDSINISESDLELLFALHHEFPKYASFMSTLYYIKFWVQNEIPVVEAIPDDQCVPYTMPVPTAPPPELVEIFETSRLPTQLSEGVDENLAE